MLSQGFVLSHTGYDTDELHPYAKNKKNQVRVKKNVLGAVSSKKSICNARQSSAGSPILMQNNFRGGIRYARHRM